MSNYLGHIIGGSLVLEHYVLHQAQTEDEALRFMEHSEDTGGLVEFLTVPVGGFTVQRVQSNFDGAADYITLSQHKITFPAATITDTIIARKQCVEWQGTRYKLQLTDKPLSLNQRWSFLATPMESV